MLSKEHPVMITGANGYVASWIVRYLLEEGYTVHGTVRNKEDQDKTAHLLEMAENSPGNLELFEADLFDVRAFESPLEHCNTVIHTAAPFIIGKVAEPQEQLIRPALEGTRNVLNAVKKFGQIQKVVLTSSALAVYGDNADILMKEGHFSEKDWNITSSTTHQPYSYAKTIAEREAWKITEAQEQWEMAVINPGFIMGPSLSRKSSSASMKLMIDMGKGKLRTGLPEIYNGLVDIRDVAKAHIKAAGSGAKGRFIIINKVVSLSEMAELLREEFPGYPLPKIVVPKWLFKLFGPLQGFTRKYVQNNVGIKIAFDISRSHKELGIEYTPVRQTLKDHFQQLIDDELI